MILELADKMTTRSKLLALLEIIGLRLIILAAVLALFASPLGIWQRQNLYYTFSTHILFILVPVAWLLALRRPLADYGITLRNFKADGIAALSCFFPVAMAGATLGFVPYTTWYGALLEAAIFTATLFFAARLLTKKLDPQSGVITIALAVLMFGGISIWKSMFPGVGRGISSFIYYLLVGFGEEILYRGYMLSRLNQVFARPHQFYGVSWGWGMILTSIIFGLSHILNGLDLTAGTFNPQWGWAFWTFFSGLVFGYIREKTGSIVAPAIVHGLPQALVYLFIQF